MDFLSIPGEVLLLVMEQLRLEEDFSALRSTSLSCKRLQPLAEAALYHTVAFRKRSSMWRISEALDSNPLRHQYINDLQLVFSTKAYEHGALSPPDLAAMPNLKYLLSESPECQPWSNKRPAYWKPDMHRYLETFEAASLRSTLDTPRPLEMLTSCGFHSRHPC